MNNNFQDIIDRILSLSGNQPFFNLHLNDYESVVGIAFDDLFFLKTDVYNKRENRETNYTANNEGFEIIEYDVKNGKQYGEKIKCSLEDFLSEVYIILKRAENFAKG